MSRVSFDDTPDSDGVAENVMLDDLERAERRITQLEANINLFIKYVASIRFTTAERDSAPWMSNWEAGLLSGYLTEPIPYVEPEPEAEDELEVPLTAEGIAGIDEAIAAGELGVADDDAEEFVIVDTDVAADVADEDALADETAVDDSEPPLSAA
jgi:hypothetical protein